MKRELARRLRLNPTTVSLAVTKLESRGYQERTVDTADARARRVRPTTSLPAFSAVMERVCTLEAVASAGVARWQSAQDARDMRCRHCRKHGDWCASFAQVSP